MTAEHPTEEQLQAHVMEPEASPDRVRQHIDSCAACQTSVSVYHRLFRALHDQPGPAFDFDVAGLVLPALPSPRAKPSSIPYLPIMLLLIIAAVPIYLFKENIANLFSGMSQFFIYASAGSAAFFVLLRLVQLIKTYNQRFKVLNHLPDLQPYSGKRV